MTHEDEGRYGLKHPPGTKVDEAIARAIREKMAVGEFTCSMAEEISKEMNVKMSEVGRTADLLEIKIRKCQLGLFGWGEGESRGKAIEPSPSVPPEMKKALEELAEKGAVTCASLWGLADRLRVERRALSSACEALGLKIRSCQLGTF
ncbi:MAG: hypothetical protein N3G78_14460 [Desulfobacterota bacterium]|nr:hypothetical protein [Thermodesulfobacteriota bacterium]